MRLPVTSYDLRSRPASSSELVNCYMNTLPQDARAPYLIHRCPGTRNLYSGGEEYPHWLIKKHPSLEQVVIVSGNLNEPLGGIFTSYDGTATNGAVSTGTASVYENQDLDANATNLVYVSQPDAFEISVASGVISPALITDTDYTSRGGGDVEFLDNFLLFREPNSGRFFGADLGSSSAFSPLNFATAEENPDKMTGMKSDSGQILLFGEKSFEVWDAAGGSGFPFRATINGAVNQGCTNGRTIALVEGRTFWVADDNTVRMLLGLEAVKVSNQAIEQQMTDDTALNSALSRGFGYAFDGQNYYVLRTANNCWVYHLETGLWHKRKSLGFDTWRYRDAETAFGKTWLVDNLGTVGASDQRGFFIAHMDADIHTELLEAQPMQWTYQPVWGQGQRVFHNWLEIVLETGVGTATVTNPLITLEYSDDGGDSWLTCSSREIGSYGEKFQRVVWYNLGAAYQRIYRASISDAVPVTVTDTLLAAKGGSV